MTTRFSVDGKKVSLFGYGAMRLPSDQETLNRQVKLMLESGITYFDTSPAYSRGESEERLGTALAASGFARKDYIIATKLSNFAPRQYPFEVCRKMFEASLKKLRTDYVDNYLLHAVGNGGFATFRKRYLDNGALDWCCEQRKARRIRNLGFSFHGDLAVWDWCLKNHNKYHWDFVQIQMNYIDWQHGRRCDPNAADAKRLYEDLTKLHIPVVVMSPLLGGALSRYNPAVAECLTAFDPEATPSKWGFRFCATFPNVMTVLSGVTRTEHLRENIVTFSPLKVCSADELSALARAAVRYLACNKVPCTACAYCMPCPFGLDIPALLAFRNDALANGSKGSAKATLKAYEEAIPDPLRRADHCTGCDRCRSHCPQQINISDEMAQIDAAIDVLKGMAIR